METRPPILDEIEQRTRELVAEKLRSKAVVVARLYDLICEAHELGHLHESIHNRLMAGGLDTSRKNYDTYLYRTKLARARAGTQGKVGSYEPRMQERGSYEPRAGNVVAVATPALAPSPPPAEPDGSATAALSALESASETGRKDYSSVVRQHMKNQRKPGK